MNRTRLFLITALFGAACTTALAADPASETARRERMDRAYEGYRHAEAHPGPAARAERSIRHGAHHTGEAIEHGAKKAGHAVGKAVHKTGKAIGRSGEKLENKSAP